ncbi:MAG TPA: glycosyltransferase family 1 protein [Armatimonadota bacterium]|nr:glycosyltransferase family 1 protein [Armatimonadota bacterium]
MRILCNCAPVHLGGGVGRYVSNLFAHMAQLAGDWSFVVAAKSDVGAEILPADPRFSLLEIPRTAARSPAVRVAWEQTRLAALARRMRPDVIFCPGNVDLLLASGAGLPSVVTVNVSQPWVRPQEFPRAAGLYLRVFVSLSRLTATTFIAPTETTRQELMHAVDIPPERIVAIPHGVDISRFRPARPGDELSAWAVAQGIRQPYIFSLSSIYRWKNFDTLLRAFAASAAPRQGVQLVIAGWPLDAQVDRELRQLSALLGVSGSVALTAGVPEQEVAALYRTARAYVFPSFFEGFGLTQIEAMASGIPLALSRASVMPEVGGDAAIYFDPEDAQDMAAAIERVLWDEPLRERLIEAGLERAPQFSWRETARRTMDVLAAAAGSRRGRRGPGK